MKIQTVERFDATTKLPNIWRRLNWTLNADSSFFLLFAHDYPLAKDLRSTRRFPGKQQVFTLKIIIVVLFEFLCPAGHHLEIAI
ncbi:hypothetical protein D3C71_1618770 [compost metagenome]